MNNELDAPFRPNWASPPGDTIKDILKERNISVASFAYVMRMPIVDIERLLSGEMPIDNDIALSLCCKFGNGVGFWLNREKQYRESLEYIASLKETN